MYNILTINYYHLIFVFINNGLNKNDEKPSLFFRCYKTKSIFL